MVELAAPDEAGERRAPIHLIFYDALEQRLLLEALARHFSSLVGAAPALYDFVTQLAAFDSPVATFLAQEIRELGLSDALPVPAGGGRFPQVQVERARAVPRCLPCASLRPVGEVGGDRGDPRWYTAARASPA